MRARRCTFLETRDRSRSENLSPSPPAATVGAAAVGAVHARIVGGRAGIGTVVGETLERVAHQLLVGGARHVQAIELGVNISIGARRIGDEDHAAAAGAIMRERLHRIGKRGDAVVDHAPDVAQQRVIASGQSRQSVIDRNGHADRYRRSGITASRARRHDSRRHVLLRHEIGRGKHRGGIVRRERLRRRTAKGFRIERGGLRHGRQRG